MCFSCDARPVALIVLTCYESSLPPTAVGLTSLPLYSLRKRNIRHHHTAEAKNYFVWRVIFCGALCSSSDGLKRGSSGTYVGLWQERDRSLALRIWHKQFFSRDLFPILYQSGKEHQTSRHTEPSSPELLACDTRRHLPSGSQDALDHLWRVQCNYFYISRACGAFPAAPSSETKQQRSDLRCRFHTTTASWFTQTGG